MTDELTHGQRLMLSQIAVLDLLGALSHKHRNLSVDESLKAIVNDLRFDAGVYQYQNASQRWIDNAPYNGPGIVEAPNVKSYIGEMAAPKSEGGELPISRRCFYNEHINCKGSWTQYPEESGPCECTCHGTR